MATNRYLQCTKKVKRHLPSARIGLKIAIYSMQFLPLLVAVINNPLCSNSSLSPEEKLDCNNYYNNPLNVAMIYTELFGWHLLEARIKNWGLNKLLTISLAINDFILDRVVTLPKQNPDQILPKNVCRYMLTFLDARSFTQVASLSKEWKQITDDSFHLMNQSKKLFLTEEKSARMNYVNFHNKYRSPSRAEKWHYKLSKIDFERIFLSIHTGQLHNLLEDHSQPSLKETEVYEIYKDLGRNGFRYYTYAPHTSFAEIKDELEADVKMIKKIVGLQKTATFDPDNAVAKQARIDRINTLRALQMQRENSTLNRHISNIGFFAGKVVDYLSSGSSYVLDKVVCCRRRK